MPTCPYCKGTYHRRSRGGRCPGCNQKVFLFEGAWYRNDLNGLPSDLLNLFEGLVAKRLSVPSFRMGANGSAARMRELGRARQLIGDVDDPDLLMEAMRLIFSHPKLAWKDRLSLVQISPSDWSAAMAIARKTTEQQRKQRHIQQQAHNDVLETMKELGL